MAALRAVLALLLLFGEGIVLAGQQPPSSLAELAAKEAERRKALSEPAKVYTATGTPHAGSPATPSACESENKFDSGSGNSYTIMRCQDGTTMQFGSNARTGSTWRTKFFRDGSAEGVDKCGNRWTYNAATTEYVNENGETRFGLGELRKQLESPAPCKAKQTEASDLIKRIDHAREELIRLQRFATALNDRISTLEDAFAATEDPDERDQISTDHAKASEELKRVRSEIHLMDFNIRLMQDQLRVALPRKF